MDHNSKNSETTLFSVRTSPNIKERITNLQYQTKLSAKDLLELMINEYELKLRSNVTLIEEYQQQMHYHLEKLDSICVNLIHKNALLERENLALKVRLEEQRPSGK